MKILHRSSRRPWPINPWPINIAIACAMVAMLIGLHPSASAQQNTYTIPLATSGTNTTLATFIRLINRSSHGGTVNILGIDDTGRRFGPVSVSLNARQTKQLSSWELENGSASEGLFTPLGDGTGDWRLALTTDLDLEALAYIRTSGGFVTSIHEVAAETQEGSRWRYHVPFFNPGSNTRQVSRLRLINPGTVDASVEITGVDDEGRGSSGGSVRFTLRGGTARMLSAQQLENGDLSQGLSGRLGAGTGKWQLSVLAERQIQVMSLLFSQLTGNLANLSRGQAGASGGGPPITVPTDAPDLVVRNFTVFPTTPVSPGSRIGTAVTVSNQGNGRSDPTTFRFYRSSDATITTSDTQVGTKSVAAIEASSFATPALGFNVPSSPGTYYYGGCVDAVPGESDTSNNCSDSVAVRVQGSGGTRYGAVAVGWQSNNCRDGIGWSAAINRSSESAARTTVLNACQNRGLIDCRAGAFLQCGSVAYGTNSLGCYWAGGAGGSSSAAEQSALSNCRNAGYTCRIPVGSTSGQKATFCNSGYQSAPLAESQTGTATLDTLHGTLDR